MGMVDNLYTIERKILYKELKPLFEALSFVNYAVIKGEVLSQQIYGVPNKRRSSDIDILIDKSNVRFLESELQKLGFEQQLPEAHDIARQNRVLCMAYSHQIPSYHKVVMGFHLNVDVNHDIFWGEYEGKRCYIEEFLNNTVDMEIYGVTVKTLPIEKAFVQLILHHYKEMNSLYHLSQHNTIRTDMFRDIYDMLKNNDECLSSGSIRRAGELYLIEEYIYYMIYYTKEVFNDSILHRCLNELQIYRNCELLDCYGLSANERKRWRVSFCDRLDNEGIYNNINEDLTPLDLKKINDNKSIFG